MTEAQPILEAQIQGPVTPARDPPALDENGSSADGYRLLSLDGGGVRGLSSLFILQRLMQKIDPDHPPKPCEVFDMIGGTSTGGLIAIMLGRLEMTTEECIDAYIALMGRVFKETWWPLNWLNWRGDVRAKFCAQELERAIKDIIGLCGYDADAPLKPDDSSECRCKVFVCATSADDTNTAYFRSYSSTNKRTEFEGVKIWEAARATSAATTCFSPIKIEHREYIDGATGCNNPVNEVWDSARSLWMPPGSTKFESNCCLVSIGTGVTDGHAFGPHYLDVAKALVAMATETERTASAFERNHGDMRQAGTYFRFNVLRGLSDIGLEEYNKEAQIRNKTIAHMNIFSEDKEMERCAKQLRKESRAVGTQHSHRSLTIERPRPKQSMLISFFKLILIIVLFLLGISMSEPTIDPSAPIIAVMGRTGTGKSTFINTLGGRHVSTKARPVIGRNLESETAQISWYLARIDGRKVYLIDTPGFDDSRIPDHEILRMISGLLRTYYQGGKLLRGIVYLHDITHRRIGGVNKKQFEVLEHLLGKNAFKNCVLVTNMWPPNPTSEVEQELLRREQELRDNYWKAMTGSGSLILQHDGSYNSARRIAFHLIDMPTVTLQHQIELVDQGKTFPQTEAGKIALSDLKDPYFDQAFEQKWEGFHVWLLVLFLIVLVLVWR
ncbi:acyl transferase/acyl hydrolase/lysophospholipase [Lasiosphaeria hispida]|uniref:Acyl transferase/acyl hydrolase/lysophospholipase n=1 Tax=Lasiosphaeria hispida TaxID=260671 RepID=A0AAJ0HGD5_9PEZI|nr:acyl transferase/acyl hydrolase/lysophospholipase [Lasiosphaeria hispida]